VKRAAWLLSFVSACAASPRTEVMIEVDAEAGVRAESQVLSVSIYGGAAADDPSTYALRRRLEIDAPTWPRRIALVPLEDDPPRGYRAIAQTQRDDASIVAGTAIVGEYAEARTVLLSIVLEDACIGVECDDAAPRCEGGECRDAFVDAESLPDLD
jgi:hypothetical protein